jgi:hypothetical protein
VHPPNHGGNPAVTLVVAALLTSFATTETSHLHESQPSKMCSK